MRNLRTYYSAEITEFLRQSNNEILGVIHSNYISLMQPYSRAILGSRKFRYSKVNYPVLQKAGYYSNTPFLAWASVWTLLCYIKYCIFA